MASGGNRDGDGGFDVFREGGLAELLGVGGFGGLLDMGEEVVEQKVRVGEGKAVGVDGFFLRCPPAYPLLSSSSPTSSSYRMLCFGGDEGFSGDRSDGFLQKPSGSGNDSCSSTSSSSSNSSLSKLEKKTVETRGGSDAADRGGTSTTTTTTITTKATTTSKSAAGANKKPRKEPPPQRPASHGRTLKVRKENLGDRICALQQLVSPFGKSDTASVLHEALGYIRFLHNQVQVLSSPYLQRLPLSGHLHVTGGGGEGGAPRHDLRSRGLCLVPVACTANVTGSNGADFWSPAMESGRVDCHQPEVSEH